MTAVAPRPWWFDACAARVYAATIVRRLPRTVTVPVFLLATLGTARASLAEDAPDTGLYTSAIFQSETAMLQAGHASGHGCVWKGRAKKEGKVICKGGPAAEVWTERMVQDRAVLDCASAPR